MSKVTFVSPDIFTLTADMILEEMNVLLTSHAERTNSFRSGRYANKVIAKINTSDSLRSFIFELPDKVDVKIITEVVEAIKEAGWHVSTSTKHELDSSGDEIVNRIIVVTLPILNK